MAWTTPMMLSVDPRQRGMRVKELSSTVRTATSGGSSALTARMEVRWIMMSETSSSPRSSTPPRRSRSALTTEPSRWRRSTAPRNSSCAESIGASFDSDRPKMASMLRTMRLTRLESGPTTTTKRRTNGATVSAKRSGEEIAQLFGRTSAKITRTTVITRVAIATPESPNRPRNRLVVNDEARMLTRLLPISSAPISRSRRSISRLTTPARASP